ncbi:Flavin-nucleotide-binding protein OS=Streptomyces albaduncus OX=68172 GN=FHS32_002262 PE=4 SV=1 [Streptomyces griseoloalbus]
MLRLDLDEVSAKLRTGGVNDEPEDLSPAPRAGVLPVRTAYGTPEPDPHLAIGTEVPGYLTAL